MPDEEKIKVASMRAVEWYFSQKFGNLLSIPSFLLLAYLFLMSVWGAFIKAYALIKVAWAVYGLVGMIALFALGWLCALLVLGPPVIHYLILTYPAVVLSERSVSWLRRLRNLIFVLLVGFLAAEGLHKANVYLIGWIADHNPCAAWDAGVTGSIPPTNCDGQSF